VGVEVRRHGGGGLEEAKGGINAKERCARVAQGVGGVHIWTYTGIMCCVGTYIYIYIYIFIYTMYVYLEVYRYIGKTI
jgi:hypothetical protein